MENPKELIKSGENDLENISFSYFSIKKKFSRSAHTAPCKNFNTCIISN